MTITVVIGSTSMGIPGVWIDRMICDYHHWLWWTAQGVLLALLLSQSYNIHLRWVHRQIASFHLGLLCQLYHGFSTGKFLFQTWNILQYFYFGVCFLLWGSDMATAHTNGNSTFWVCTTATLQSILMLGICASWCWLLAHSTGESNSVPQLLWVKGTSYCSNYCFQTTHAVWWGVQLWALRRITWSPCLPYMVVRVFFPGWVPPSDMGDSELVVWGKPCDSRVVIQYQVDNFTCIWLA